MKTWCKGTLTSRTFVWKHVMSQFEYALWGKERSSVELAEKSGTMIEEFIFRDFLLRIFLQRRQASQ